MSSNYPPGTSASDPRAPWNQDEIEVDVDDLLEYIEDELLGDLIYEDEDAATAESRWLVESGPDGIFADYGEWLKFRTKEDCIALLLCERESWLDEKAAERKQEQEIERHLDGPDEGF